MAHQFLTTVLFVICACSSALANPEKSDNSAGDSDAASYDTNYLDYYPGHRLSDLVNMADNADYSPKALNKIAKRFSDLSDSDTSSLLHEGASNMDKRAIRLIRLGKRLNDKRAIRLIRLGKRLNDKRDIRLIRLGKRFNDKRAIRLIRLGKRFNDKRAIRLIRLGKRSNDKRDIRLIRLGKRGLDKRAIRLIRLGKRFGLRKRPMTEGGYDMDFENPYKGLVEDADSDEDSDKKGKPIIRLG